MRLSILTILNTTSTVTAQPGKVYVPELNDWYSLSDIQIHNVYFKNNIWSNNIYAYLWKDNSSPTVQNAAFPGNPMKKIGNTTYFVYSYYTVGNQTRFDKVIFSRVKSSTDILKTGNNNLPETTNGEVYYYDSANDNNKYTGTWKQPSKNIDITLHYSDYKLAQKTDTGSLQEW